MLALLRVSSSDPPVLVGLPGGNCLQRPLGNFMFWRKAGWLREIWDLVLIWGRLTYVQKSVCSEGQDVRNSSVLSFSISIVHLSSLIENVLKVGYWSE